MKRIMCTLLSIIMFVTAVLGSTVVTNANTMNTAEKISAGKTYSYNYTYEIIDDEEVGEDTHYYSFIAEKGAANCEVYLTINSQITDDLLDNIYLELIDETDTIVADGNYIPSKKAFYMNYEDLEENHTYFIRVECFDKANISVKLSFHKHSYDKKELDYAADIYDDGYYYMTCSCGEEKEYTIPQIKTVSISKSTYVYDGKAKKPSVTVKDRKGKTLKNGTDYTVSYAKGRKNVGKYTVTIKFKGNYYGTVKKTFNIIPKATTLSNLTAKSNSFTVKWKKQTTQTTGYQIQYSTDKNFKKNNKSVTVSKNKTTSKTISKLKAKKKYYVRIRTYKTVKVNGKSTKIYSSWSKAKSVTTKAQATTTKKTTVKKTSKTVYRTPSGKRYHYSSTCGGKNSYSVSLDTAVSSGLTPCSKCC